MATTLLGIASTYNVFFFYDSLISNPTFVADVVNVTTFSIAAEAKKIEDDHNSNPLFDKVFDDSVEFFENVGFILQDTSHVDNRLLCAVLDDTNTFPEFIASAYTHFDGIDAQELGTLMISWDDDNNHRESDFTDDTSPADVINAWSSQSLCKILDEGEETCTTGLGDHTTIIYLSQGKTEADLALRAYTFVFSTRNEDLPAALRKKEQPKVALLIDKLIVNSWTFNQAVYDSVRDTISDKIEDAPQVAHKTRSPVTVVSSEETINAYTPMGFLQCAVGGGGIKPGDDVDASPSSSAASGDFSYCSTSTGLAMLGKTAMVVAILLI